MTLARCRLAVALLLGSAGGCGGRPVEPALPLPSRVDSAMASTALPAVPEVRGPLVLRVAYPPPDATVQVRDSSFLFGSAGTGEARVSINGHPVRVWPNGAWLAWLPFPPDSLMQFSIEGRTATDSALLTYALRRPPRAAEPLDSLSLTPRGRVWWPRDEYLTLAARASEGSEVRVRLPDGTMVPLTARAEPDEIPAGVRAFDRDSGSLRVTLRQGRYVGVIRGRTLGPEPGPVLSPPAPAPPLSVAPGTATVLANTDSATLDSSWAVVEAIRGLDTVRARWPLQLALLDTLPQLVELDDDSAGLGDTDGLTVGRALPGGTYNWFFPAGTLAPISGRLNGDLRVRLSPVSQAWVPVADGRPATTASAAPAVVGSVVLSPRHDRVVVRVPVSRRVPFQVLESERSIALRLYGSAGDVNWIQYGKADSLVLRMAWTQSAAEEVTFTLDLARPVWGYRTRWDGGDLLLEIRRPPVLDEGSPLRGRPIAVDPGHPPAGSTGPTGLREAEANLGVSLELRSLPEAEGARVLLTRTNDSAVDLWPRVQLAENANADLLVSIHNNALPDGINPFTNSGTSVYYNQARSIPLARAVQAALVQRLGLRDLGIGRGDLALVRATWMPSVLTEGLFMILPDQEAALRSPAGRRLYALAVFEGLRRFLRERARER